MNERRMLDEIAEALRPLHGSGAFATELTCGSDDLQLEVTGVGPIRFPISITMSRKLCLVAAKAHFGRRGETLLDERVRDTWEIRKSQIKIDARAWRRTLDRELASLRRLLGLPDGGKLVPVFDKLLVYAPGQFFAPHQDSERADDMIASLVVELPSKHEGGAFVVQHHGKKEVFRGATRGPKDLSFVAFYADCHHEVKPVTSGYRIALTYQLLHRPGARPDRPSLDSSAVERVATSVSDYFSTPVATPYSKAAPAPPDRLIYLLDHEYTQKSLGWTRLKNADRLRVTALRQVAERLDCQLYLALADVHESWSCDDGDWGGGYGARGRYGGRGYRGRDGPDEERDAGEYALIELFDTEFELRHWIDAEGGATNGVSTDPTMREVCFTRASKELDPFKSEHEGYMGNYGNTVDRWYHRAALVMWPRSRDFAVRARLSPSWAVDELAKRLESRAADEALKMAQELLAFWSGIAGQVSSDAFVSKLFAVLASLDDAELALGLLAPLGPHRLSIHATPAFVALVERYGSPWSERVFSAWSASAGHGAPRWLPLLPGLCAALVGGGKQGNALAAWLLKRETDALKRRHIAVLEMPGSVRDASGTHVQDLVALFETAALIGAPAVREDLVAVLVAPQTALPVVAAGSLLVQCRERHAPAAVRNLRLDRLYGHVVGALERILGGQQRSADDWSIEPPPGCVCELCTELSRFLRDRDRVRHAWPLSKERRRHIHNVIDRHGLPVTHETIRRGSPLTLVLTKQRALFEREVELRARQKALLASLMKQAKAFSRT